MSTWLHRYGPLLAAASAFLGLMLMILAGLYTVRQQNLVDHKLCVSTLDNRRSTRAAWLSVGVILKKGVDINRDMTQAQKDAANARTDEFIREVLRPIPPLACVNNKPVPKEGP